MPLNTFSFRRRWDSYAIVQDWIGRWQRNRRAQLRQPRARALRYADLGCGLSRHAALLNVDWQWTPGLDLCWDIRCGLPFADNSMLGLYTEHCLEHFDLADAAYVLGEARRVLASGGTLRVVVPDAELYLRRYVQHLDGVPRESFPYEDVERRDPRWVPLGSVNRVFYQDRYSPAGHRTMFDFELLRRLASQAGFTTVDRASFRIGRDRVLLVDSDARRSESLYVEAVAP